MNTYILCIYPFLQVPKGVQINKDPEHACATGKRKSLMLRDDFASSEEVKARSLHLRIALAAEVERKHVFHLGLGRALTHMHLLPIPTRTEKMGRS